MRTHPHGWRQQCEAHNHHSGAGDGAEKPLVVGTAHRVYSHGDLTLNPASGICIYLFVRILEHKNHAYIPTVANFELNITLMYAEERTGGLFYASYFNEAAS